MKTNNSDLMAGFVEQPWQVLSRFRSTIHRIAITALLTMVAMAGTLALAQQKSNNQDTQNQPQTKDRFGSDLFPRLWLRFVMLDWRDLEESTKHAMVPCPGYRDDVGVGRILCGRVLRAEDRGDGAVDLEYAY